MMVVYFILEQAFPFKLEVASQHLDRGMRIIIYMWVP